MKALALLALVACGSSHGVMGDGGGGDSSGSGDAQAIDAPPVRGNVTVRLVDKTGAALAGLHVVFIDTDNTVSDLTTDSAGQAQASVFQGASVTAIQVTAEPTPPDIECLTTVTQIAPGDAITLDMDACIKGETPLDSTSAGAMTLAIPSYSGANHYVVYGPCGAISGSTTQTLDFSVGCAASTFDVMVLAENSSNAVLGFTSKSSIAFAPGGTATITDTWHSLPTISATYSNPTGVQNVQLTRFAPYVRAGSVLPPPPTASKDTAGTTTMLTVTAAAPARAVMQTYANPCATGDTTCTQMNSSSQLITQVVDGTQTTYSLDLSSVLLPWLAYPYWDYTNPGVLPVTATGTGTADLFEVDLLYVRNNSSGTIFQWRVFGPEAASFDFPTLPADVPNSPTPTSNDRQSVSHAFLCESDAIAGYRAAVANPYAALGTCQSTPDPKQARFGGTLNRLSQSN